MSERRYLLPGFHGKFFHFRIFNCSHSFVKVVRRFFADFKKAKSDKSLSKTWSSLGLCSVDEKDQKSSSWGLSWYFFWSHWSLGEFYHCVLYLEPSLFLFKNRFWCFIINLAAIAAWPSKSRSRPWLRHVIITTMESFLSQSQFFKWIIFKVLIFNEN